MADSPPAVSGPTVTTLAVAALQAMRPKQWTKNGLLFAAIVFSMKFLEWGPWARASLGFASFCLISSAGYILNDARDADADRRHPTKRLRPIASGRLPVGLAAAEMVVIFLAGCGIAWWLSPWFLLVALLYFVTTVSYSIVFKHIVILDVMFLSSGFLWRAAAGAVAIGVGISAWLLTCTAFLALFLGFNKRRGELTLMAGDAAITRKNLRDYTPEFVAEIQAITTSGSIISYALYTVLASPTPWLLLTLPYVLYGVFRYIYLVTVRNEGAAPDEILLRDRPILVTCLMYAATVVVILMVAPLTRTT